MIVSLIAAASTNRVIGIGNELPWKLPADMQFFKEKTTGHAILMGRITWEILGKPLPNRTSIVISSQNLLLPDGVFQFNSIKAGIAHALELGETELMIIGGAKIYKAALHLADRIYLTHVYTKIQNGTSYFPPIHVKDWHIVASESRPKDEKNPLPMDFLVLEKKRKPTHFHEQA